MKPIGIYTVMGILLLVAAALAAVGLACLATLTAPLHSPGYAAEFLCPPGSQLFSEWYRATFNEPGERTLSVTCVNFDGEPVPGNQRNERTLFKGVRLYFPVFFAQLLALGAIGLAGAAWLVNFLRSKA